MDIELFKNPSKEYRPMPFWAWNERLKREELLFQIREMDQQGWGGFFMHARKGLITPYMSEEWMDLVSTCVAEARKRGMGAWLYDEDKWPSGFCGGEIPKKGKEYRQKALLMRENVLELPREDVEVLKVYACLKISDKQYKSLVEIKEDEADHWQAKGYMILYFYKWTQPIGPNRFNNTAWVDLLNPLVTDAFIESTHEKYRQRFSESFGKSIPGIFTDESTVLYWAYAPQIALPWSQNFEYYFEEYNGYSIREYLPYLFIDLEGFERIRYDYWKTITYYFIQNYVKRIYDWCQANGLKYTGHFMAEDYFEFTMQYIGALMPIYEYMHIPGVDHLNRNINDIMSIKQVTSVAHQLGKERALCEIYGCSGQNLSFEEQKWITDWAFVHGINLINPHLALYSMRGERKRDYPPDLFYQQPWWQFNKKMADYCSRLSYALTRGQRLTDILVIHTIESAWCCYNPTDVVLEEEGQFDTPDTWIEYKPSPEFMVNRLNNSFDRLLNMLLNIHYDYDLGDESLIAKYGLVKDGLFRVGEHGYKVVIVPPSITLRHSTLQLLQAFMKSGGTVIFIEDLPYLVDGRNQISVELEYMRHKATVIPLEDISLKHVLDKYLPPTIAINGDRHEKIWYHMRQESTKLIIFFANTDRDNSIDVEIDIDAIGHVEQWDALSGSVNPIYYSIVNNKVHVSHLFEPCGSLLLVINKDEMPRSVSQALESVVETFELPVQWSIVPLSDNCLTLDYCSYSIGDNVFSERMPCYKVYDILASKIAKRFTLRYSFECNDWDGSNGLVVIEEPSRYMVTFNGVNIDQRFSDGYWLDKCFKTAVIGDILKSGTNTIDITYERIDDIEVESIYILGNFEVNNIDDRYFELRQKEHRRKAGNLTKDGYPFFIGQMMFQQQFELNEKKEGRYIFELDQQGSIVVQVTVNGVMLDEAIWRPYRFDITPYIREGANDIVVTLTTSLHNLLGPHHSTKGEVIACAPASFQDEKHWTDSYYFVELGIRRAWISRIIS